ncbi:hypothetical protein [Salisediminibacterium selenitireducens]|uniref:Lipoprotein n=1 Tax=Bacillus selenitireducens (strain ATCC 700615 / DSM 15326 / MLS10) TaxID=439292 RepID=D6Y0P6_BACIE|nr:hypothetical protein [Salisediminibacterium selenitireducens]ADI00614.1 hypothetical protein Bsel_3132 [[Bacillus] selenitireducens MLS10]
MKKKALIGLFSSMLALGVMGACGNVDDLNDDLNDDPMMENNDPMNDDM